MLIDFTDSQINSLQGFYTFVEVCSRGVRNNEGGTADSKALSHLPTRGSET